MKNTSIKALIPVSVMALTLTPVAIAQIAYVKNNNNAGVDSLRWAVNELQTNAAISEIVIKSNVGTINLTSTVSYNSAKKFKLTTEGGATKLITESQAGSFTLLNVASSDVDIDDIKFKLGRGLFISTVGANSNVRVDLSDVSVEQSSGTGIHISSTTSQKLTAVFSNPEIFSCGSHGINISRQGGDTDVELWGGEFGYNLNGALGNFVVTNSSGDGTVKFDACCTHFYNSGEDAIEIEEHDEGDVTAYVSYLALGPDIGEDALNFQEEDEGDNSVTLSSVDIDDVGSTNNHHGVEVEENDGNANAAGQAIVKIYSCEITDINAGDCVNIHPNHHGDVDIDIYTSTFNTGRDGLHLEPKNNFQDFVNVLISGSTIENNRDDGIQIETAGGAFNDTVDIKNNVPITNYQPNGDEDLNLNGTWETRLGYAAPGQLAP